MIGQNEIVVAAGVQIQFTVFDKIRGKFREMNHFGGFGVFEFCAGDGRHWFFQKISRPVHGIHVLVDDPPHVSAFPAKYPFDPKTLGLGIHLGIKALHHFMRGKGAKIAAFGSVGAPGDIKAINFFQIMEKKQISHTGICARICEYVSGRCNKENVSAFFVKIWFHPNPGNFLKVIHEEIEHVLKCMGLNPQVVTGAITIGDWRCNPVDVKANQVEELPGHHRDFRRVDAVGAKNRTPPAFRTLKEIIPQFL